VNAVSPTFSTVTLKGDAVPGHDTLLRSVACHHVVVYRTHAREHDTAWCGHRMAVEIERTQLRQKRHHRCTYQHICFVEEHDEPSHACAHPLHAATQRRGRM
jgi:hypothetical protein